MSSTNKTTNYELSQFVETDKPAWLTDYNGDMRKLDTALKAVSDVADGASGGISSLTDRMTAAEGAITTNANDIDALEARADALEAQAQSTAGRIIGIESEQITQNAGIEAATELGYNLARPYDSASTYAVGAYVLFQNTLYKCITAIATGEVFDPTKWLAIKATDEISAGGYTLPIASASLLGGVKIGSGLSIDPVTGLLSASGGVNRVILDNLSTYPNDHLFNPRIIRAKVFTPSGTATTTDAVNKQIILSTVTAYEIGNISLISFSYRIQFDNIPVSNAYVELSIALQLNTNHPNANYFTNKSVDAISSYVRDSANLTIEGLDVSSNEIATRTQTWYNGTNLYVNDISVKGSYLLYPINT